MARPKTAYRNELKARVTDDVWSAVRMDVDSTGLSESRVIAEALKVYYFGTIGSVPPVLAGSSHEMAQSGTKTNA